MFVTSFEKEDRDFRRKKTAWAIAVTVLVHSVVLLWLFFTILHTPIPPFAENAGGMSVNFGFDEVGTGETQPFSYNPGPMEASPQSAAPAAAQQAPEDILSQENGEEAVVTPKAEKKPETKPDSKALFKSPKTPSAGKATTANSAADNPTPQPKADPNALFTKGAYGAPNNSKGDGTGGGQGDQGKPDGDPNSKNYLGDGSGNGKGPGSGDLDGSFSLAGRKKVSLPPPQTCNSQGKVVVKIKVDRSGKVVNAEFERFKSTVFDPCNVNNALAAARKSTFDAAPNAPETQEGTITYIYKVH